MSIQMLSTKPIVSTTSTTSTASISFTTSTPAKSTVKYSIDVLQDEARHLVERGIVSRQQPIYVLCEYIPARDWLCVECELESRNFLLRDRIGDLMGSEVWDND